MKNKISLDENQYFNFKEINDLICLLVDEDGIDGVRFETSQYNGKKFAIVAERSEQPDRKLSRDERLSLYNSELSIICDDGRSLSLSDYIIKDCNLAPTDSWREITYNTYYSGIIITFSMGKEKLEIKFGSDNIESADGFKNKVTSNCYFLTYNNGELDSYFESDYNKCELYNEDEFSEFSVSFTDEDTCELKFGLNSDPRKYGRFNGIFSDDGDVIKINYGNYGDENEVRKEYLGVLSKREDLNNLIDGDILTTEALSKIICSLEDEIAIKKETLDKYEELEHIYPVIKEKIQKLVKVRDDFLKGKMNYLFSKDELLFIINELREVIGKKKKFKTEIIDNFVNSLSENEVKVLRKKINRV